jgi:predicted O-methyltransferase YrrM
VQSARRVEQNLCLVPIRKVIATDDLTCIGFPAALPALEERSKAVHFGMASEPLLGALLRVLAASKPGGRFLELGTGTGIATSWILAGMDVDSILVSVDNDAGVQQVAAEMLGHDKRLTFVTEDGTAFLRKQPAQCFDLVFADALPGKYDGVEDALSIVKVGGFYVIDDMLPQPNWPEGHAEKVPALIEKLASRPDFSILPLVWASGVVIAVKKR